MECLQEKSVERLRKANRVIIGKIPQVKNTTQSFLALTRGPDWPRQKEDAEQMRGPLCKIEELNPHVKKKVVMEKMKQRLKLAKENMAKNIKRSQERKGKKANRAAHKKEEYWA
jgi:hypothetical protein